MLCCLRKQECCEELLHNRRAAGRVRGVRRVEWGGRSTAEVRQVEGHVHTQLPQTGRDTAAGTHRRGRSGASLFRSSLIAKHSKNSINTVWLLNNTLLVAKIRKNCSNTALLLTYASLVAKLSSNSTNTAQLLNNTSLVVRTALKWLIIGK